MSAIISEKALQDSVIEAAHVYGYRVAHFRSVPVKRGTRVVWETPVQADGKGFPDLVLVGNGKLIWIELKAATGRLSEEQKQWQEALEASGQEVHVFRPEDWLSGRIDEVLRAA